MYDIYLYIPLVTRAALQVLHTRAHVTKVSSAKYVWPLCIPAVASSAAGPLPLDVSMLPFPLPEGSGVAGAPLLLPLPLRGDAFWLFSGSALALSAVTCKPKTAIWRMR